MLARLFEKGESRAARQIQTAYRKYVHKKRLAEKERIAKERRLRDQKEEDERKQRMVDRKKHKNSVVGRIQDGLHWAGSHMNWLTSKYDPNGTQLDERDAEKRAKAAMKVSDELRSRVLSTPNCTLVISNMPVIQPLMRLSLHFVAHQNWPQKARAWTGQKGGSNQQRDMGQ